METNNKSAGTQIKNPKLIIVVSAFAAFLATFNETYLNIAFTPIMQDTGVGVATVQWLAAAYMLGAAVMVPVSAFAYRSIPTRILLVAGICCYGSLQDYPCYAFCAVRFSSGTSPI